ncbi:hypothetical protein PoB_003653100 [Plakobranchus ocellatus]|uniref:Uncharacterized protein n=1 Tax=Plakobranchus ocellatus TaxID=259542 RepID=A0AAV4APC9_9GAST|nr:hypothetical protein PoB_003653100 [Plakobranchus ocellatus]
MVSISYRNQNDDDNNVDDYDDDDDCRGDDDDNNHSFFYKASPHQGDLRLSDPPSGLGAGDGTRNRDRRVPADLKADSIATVPPNS